VEEALDIPMAGGEEEFGVHAFRYLIGNEVFQIVQPDLSYYGGMIRTMQVARMAEAESYDDEQKAYQRVLELVQNYPNLTGFLGSASTDVAGIGRAVQELGLEEETCVVGTSLPSLAGQYLKSGAVDMIAFWDPADAGFVMDQVALRVLEGEEIRSGDNLGAPG